MNDIRLLIFPLDLDDAEPVIRLANSVGIATIGASSAMSGPGAHAVGEFVRLPYITDPGFADAFATVLAERGITAVFAPHQVVWRHLEQLLRSAPERFRFTLCAPDPISATSLKFARHDAWADHAIHAWISEAISESKPPRAALTRSGYAALHRMFLGTPGDTDEGKLLALCDIVRLLPSGDMLEVGSLYGRSALALAYLAGRHQIGNVICVDPWSAQQLSDQGSQAAMLDGERLVIDLERVFEIFLSSAAQVDNLGYIRATSNNAHPIYQAAQRDGHLDSAMLGRIALAPQLSLLHIDGNHRYDHVRHDIETWSPHLAPGGWLLLDDYLWAFGDGPRRAGDELLSSPLYDSAFVCGDTLFLRRKD